MNNKTIKVLIFIVMMAYIVSPDFFPGPIDDFILSVYTLIASTRKQIMVS